MEHKSRGYCLTCNNYTDEHVSALKNLKYRYLIIGDEKGEGGTPHLEVYVYFASAISFGSIKKKVGTQFHIEAAKTTTAAADYCKKEKIMFEDGDPPAQGKRVDLMAIRDQIVLEHKSVDDICMEMPEVYHQYGRTLHKIEDIALRKRFRTEMTKGIWYHGPTGAGKSHEAFQDFNPATHYVKNLRDDWWDGYTGQEVVIFNEFRGQLPYAEMLELCDKWPTTVKRRNREPVPFLAKEIRVTSALEPNKVYGGVCDREDNIAQLLRRFEVKKVGYSLAMNEPPQEAESREVLPLTCM